MNAIAERRQSLWDIEAEWRELAEARFEAESIEDPAEREAAIVANNEAIARCAGARLQKADGIIHFREFFGAMLDANERQGKRIKARGEAIKSLLARVDCATLAAMEAAGKKKIFGSDGSYLLSKTNGGKQALIVEDPAMLPGDCCRMEGWISAELWGGLVEFLDVYGYQVCADKISLKRVPDNEAIRAKLAEPCPACAGTGVKQPPPPVTEDGICRVCGGSGKNAVPGAYLAERGTSLVVR